MQRQNAKTDQREMMDISHCTNASLRKATRALTQLYDAALQPAGLRATQFALLGVLSKRGELPLTQLAEVLVMDRTTLSRNLKPLVKQGLLRVGNGADQRVRIIRLSNDGRARLQEATRFWRDAQQRLVGGLGQERWNGLLDDLAAAVRVAQGV